MHRRGGRCWNHNTSASHYDLIIFQKKKIDSWWQNCVWNASEIMKNQQPITLKAVFLVAPWPQNAHNNISRELKSVCATQWNAGGYMACSGMISPSVIKLWHSCTYGEYCHSERLLIRRLCSTQVRECFVHAVRGRELKTCLDYCI